MKYMGSKRWMLENGLGDVLSRLALKSQRFVDLFAGTGAVSSHVASKSPITVMASDLQKFSAVLTQAVIGRREPLEPNMIWKRWYQRAEKIVKGYSLPVSRRFMKSYVQQCRKWSETQISLPITKAYGGHYFSPEQAVWFDALRRTLPRRKLNRVVALAALIHAASRCAASPGHTAQPFQPTRRAKRYLRDAWTRNVPEQTKEALKELSLMHALRVGKASVVDANVAARRVREGDLVFIDPPYSGVHYSRFYHVLETITRGRPGGEVTGAGRYPRPTQRPWSKFSVKSESEAAFKSLLRGISKRMAMAIITFPEHVCSNGLSGKSVRKIASEYFRVTEKVVVSKFSTLGGTNNGVNRRAARRRTRELILILTPKKRIPS